MFKKYICYIFIRTQNIGRQSNFFVINDLVYTFSNNFLYLQTDILKMYYMTSNIIHDIAHVTFIY